MLLSIPIFYIVSENKYIWFQTISKQSTAGKQRQCPF